MLKKQRKLLILPIKRLTRLLKKQTYKVSFKIFSIQTVKIDQSRRNPDLSFILDAQNAYDIAAAKKAQLEADKVAAQTALDNANALGVDLAKNAADNAATIAANTATIADMEAQIEKMKKKLKLFVFSG